MDNKNKAKNNSVKTSSDEICLNYFARSGNEEDEPLPLDKVDEERYALMQSYFDLIISKNRELLHSEV